MNKLIIIVIFISIVRGVPFNPGNTLRNCIPVKTCATCVGYNSLSSFRTIDGTCNNLKKKTQGSANTELFRLLRADYVDRRKVDTPRGFPGSETEQKVPTAHEVSRAVFKVDIENKKSSQGLSLMVMTFGQFLDHDISSTPHSSCPNPDCSSLNAFKYPCFPIKFNRDGPNCTAFGRSQPTCQALGKLRQPRGQINELSSYIDLSMVYSNDFQQHQKLRKLDGSGELKLTKQKLLPIELPFSSPSCNNPAGCSLVGDSRGDENIALSSMHTLWARNHNLLVKELKSQNSKWDEHKLFETARKINIAIFQHIVYNEYVPLLAKLKKYKGYNSNVDASIASGFSTAAYRYGHSLIPNFWAILDNTFNPIAEPEPIQRSFFNTTIIRKNGIENIMYGLLGNQSQKVDTSFAHGIARRLFVPVNQNTYRDLTALNIQRGRDHGIPTYGKWRNFCNLEELKKSSDLFGVMPLKAAYELSALFKNPNDIDLFAAGIAETTKCNSVVGTTFQCIIKNQFERLRDGDRFFYQRRGVFSKAQFAQIKKMSLAKVLCNNLKGVVSLQNNAFDAPNARTRRRVCDSILGMNLKHW